MSKAVLILDMPSSCRKCDLRVIGIDNFCTGADCRKIDQMEIINEDIKPDWCPLRELPEKKEDGEALKIAIENDCYDGSMEDKAYLNGYDRGYNDCIDKLLKAE